MATVPKKLVIVSGDFHQDIAETMIASARSEAEEAGVSEIKVVKVPGSYELPIVVDKAFAGDTNVAVVLGYIEKGETLHGEVMGNAVHKTLLELELKHGKPIGFGIIGPGATPEQAQTRKDHYGASAVKAVLRIYDTVENL